MRTFAQLTCLTLGAAALGGIAGLAATAVVDPGSAVVVAVVMALGTLVIGLLEWTDHRRSGVSHAFHGADGQHRSDRDTLQRSTRSAPVVLATSPEGSETAPIYRWPSLGLPTWSTAVADSGTALLSGGPMAPHRS